ncbi:hypothetical protein [Variovorax fucosicus]|uniref:hypothetical protein n=1 Tax=Variovorax fucosicus TaxID=3053517 RepID=UPI002576E337|nr:hypothetical protein [Variovorax sp. J22G47]MDM0055262.1 hypothetical protein [Variovorax sp. J22G47]
MTSFVHVDQPQVHPGVQRAEILFGRFNEVRRNGASSRHLILLLLVAVLASAMVVVDTLVSNWTEASVLAAWVALCAFAFAALALYADIFRAGFARVAAVFRESAQNRAAARADARFLATAQSDPRVMQELQAAISRRNSDAEVAAGTQPAAPALKAKRSEEGQVPTLYEAMRRLNASRYY